jgi:cytoskeletal protein CcmA (bactofilin family)
VRGATLPAGDMKRIAVIALLAFCWILPGSAYAADTKERIVVVGDVLVDRGQTTKDVLVANGDVTVRGTVDGDLAVADGDVTIRGHVTGDVVTLAGRATLGRRAQVDGDVAYGDKKPQVAPGAQVGGKVKKFKPENFAGGAIALQIAVWLAVTISVLVLGLILLVLFPRAADAVARAARARTGRAALIGLLTFFLIPIVGFIALITVVGIPLGAGLLLAMLPIYALAYTASAFVVGRQVSKKGGRILAFAIGVVILRVLALVPFLGGLVWFLATILGLGALLVAGRTARA